MIDKAGELEYQAARASKISVAATPEAIFERYRRNKHWDLFTYEYLFHAMGDIRGKRVLDFGCGEGEISTLLARYGAAVTAVDISPELIELARARIAADGGTGNTEFLEMDILESDLPRNCFDFVIGSAVLHHVDLYQVTPKLFEFVKPGGRIFFIEPIAYSPALQKLRDLTPVSNDKSPDERQLNRKDINFISKTCGNGEITYFHGFGRLARVFPGSLHLPAARVLCRIDRTLLNAFPALHKYYGIVMIEGRKPAARPAA